MIGYQGVPNVIFQHDEDGGVHDKARPTDFRLKQRLRSRTSIIRACRAILATYRIPAIR